MSQQHELGVSIPPKINEINFGGDSCDIETEALKRRAGSCETCTIARGLTGEARELLLRNCLGLKLVVNGCEKRLICQSPYKENAQMS